MLANWIFDWAGRTPDKVAVIHNGQPITYRQFAWLIMRARAFFHDLGVVGPGVAPVLIGNLMDFWFVEVALRSLGLTTVSARSVEMLADLNLTKVALVATHRAEHWHGLDALCDAQGWRCVAVSIENGAELPPDAGPRMADGGHIFTTSGTTGAYKKVLFDPAAEDEQCLRRAELWGIDARSVTTLFSFGTHAAGSYRAAASVWMTGGAVVFQEGPWHLGLSRPDITQAPMTPAVVDAVLSAPPDAIVRNEHLAVNVGGGPLTRRQAEALKQRVSPHLFTVLGTTEAGTIALTQIRTPEDLRWHQPAPRRRVEIVDDDHRPVPVGQVGLLRANVTGINGYLDDEEATARFFHDGFFYPGDLAVMREDGRFALQGRVTDVLNLAGNKVAPAPIEEALREELDVAGVCLFTQQDEAGEEQLHVAIEAARPVAPEALAAALRAHFRVFAGAHVHYVEALPRDPAGKLQRRAARALALGLPA